MLYCEELAGVQIYPEVYLPERTGAGYLALLPSDRQDLSCSSAPVDGVSGSRRHGGEGLLQMSPSSPIPLAEARDDPDADPAKGPDRVLRCGAAKAEVDKSPESNKSWGASPLLFEEGDGPAAADAGRARCIPRRRRCSRQESDPGAADASRASPGGVL